MSAVLNKTFKGKFVRVLESGSMDMQMDDSGQISPVNAGMAHQGYFVDSDDKFVILGDKKGKKLIGMFAISVNSITNIMFADEEDTMQMPDIAMGELN